MTYYALYDMQTGDYMHSGRNATTLDELKEALLSYIEPDIEEVERDDINAMGVQGIAEAWDLDIHTSETKFPEEADSGAW